MAPAALAGEQVSARLERAGLAPMPHGRSDATKSSRRLAWRFFHHRQNAGQVVRGDALQLPKIGRLYRGEVCTVLPDCRCRTTFSRCVALVPTGSGGAGYGHIGIVGEPGLIDSGLSPGFGDEEEGPGMIEREEDDSSKPSGRRGYAGDSRLPRARCRQVDGV